MLICNRLLSFCISTKQRQGFNPCQNPVSQPRRDKIEKKWEKEKNKQKCAIQACAINSKGGKQGKLKFGQGLVNFISGNFLLFGLGIAVVMGVTFPEVASSCSKLVSYATITVFIICGLSIGLKDVRDVPYFPALYGLLSILLLAPLLSWILLSNLHQVNLAVRQVLFIYACGPTALSVGVSLTQVLGGNVSLALLLVLSSSLLATLSASFWIPLFLQFKAGIGSSQLIAPKQQFISLVRIIIVPLMFGMIARKPIQSYVDQRRKTLSKISLMCLSTIIWVQVGKCVMTKTTVQFMDGVSGLLFGIIQHLLFLMVNYFVLGILFPNCSQKTRQVVTIIASQKALQVCVVVIAQLTLSGVLSSNPVYLLVPVMAHFVQIVVDSYIVNRWVAQDGDVKLA